MIFWSRVHLDEIMYKYDATLPTLKLASDGVSF